MSEKSVKITYWAATGLVALVYLGGATFYITAHDMVAGMYEGLLKYPTYIIWPLAILKIVAAVVILWRPSTFLSDFAYAAMFWHLLLAASAHIAAGDPGLAAGDHRMGGTDHIVPDAKPGSRKEIALR